MSKLKCVLFVVGLIALSIIYMPLGIFDIIIGVLSCLLSGDGDFGSKIIGVFKRNYKRFVKICKAVKLINEDSFSYLLDLIDAIM